MKQPHPLYLALADAFARKAGIDPQAIRNACDGLPSDKRLVDALVSAFFPLVPPGSFVIEGLPTDTDAATIDTHMLQESTQAKIRGPQPASHRWTKALRKRGMSVAQWARLHDVGYSAARSWLQKGPGGRAIPRAFQRIIEKEDGVPESAWPHGVIDRK